VTTVSTSGNMPPLAYHGSSQQGVRGSREGRGVRGREGIYEADSLKLNMETLL